MTRQEDEWTCTNCGTPQGRHDMWFEGDVCGNCEHNTMTNQDKVLKVVMERYGSLSTLKMAMWEDEDVVLVNLADDLDDELEESEILEIIHKLLS